MKCFVLSLLASFAFTAASSAAPREKEWKQLEELARTENTDSAVSLLKQIEAAATAEKAWPEAAKAMAMRLRLEAVKQEDDSMALTRMEEAITKAPAEMKPILLALHATFYHRYFLRHRWEIMQRTAVAGPAPKDMASWDLKQVLTETDARFQKALENAAALKASPVTQWNGLLDAGTLPDSYQPTLYDFVARQALQFYTAAGQEAMEVAAENAFEFSPDSPALASLNEFLAWKPGAGPGPKLRTIRLYQSLLAFHREDADPGARVLLDVERLEWAAAATGQGADERKLSQLRALATQNAAHESSLLAVAPAAEILFKQKKPAEAHALLTQSLAAHSKSAFAPRCRNVIKQIEQKELSASTELLWNTAGPEIHFTARNLDKIYFRLISVSKEPDPTLLSMMDDEEQIVKVLRKKPARAWALDLLKTEDFREQTHHVPAPVDLKPGFYILAVSGNADFTKRHNQISFAPVLVSPLALIDRVRREGENTAVDAWVLDAVTGDPIPNAEVSIWVEDEKTEKPVPVKKVLSDANGFASLVGDWDSGGTLFAVRGDDRAVTPDLSSPGSPGPKDRGEPASTFFFTDRAIYRPGQTIQFKGIRVRHHADKNDYRTLADVKRTVVLKDANDRELAKLDVTTNAFGSFTGSFTAPQNGLTGEMTVRDGNDHAQIRVEEYKRPKFKVEVLPPALAPKLGEPVVVKVKAIGYTGAPVDGAKVVWHVQRQAEWLPWIRGAWWFHTSSPEKEIARGEATTGADGTAEVKFTAEPDKSVDEKTSPWFHYSVHADITDTAGETRSADGGVRAGYVAMKASIEADDWQTVKKPVAFKVTTATLDDVPQKASGKLTVHRLVQPEKVHRPWLDDEYDDDGTTVKDLSDPETWDLGEAVQRDDFSTDEKGEATVSIKLAAGAYRAVLESKDRFGKKVTAQTLVLVVDPAADKFPVKIPFWSGAKSLVLQPGDDLSALWGSGYDRARAFVQIEHRGRVVQSFWSDAARTQQGVDFKVKEDHRGGFAVHILQMRENRLLTHTLPVSVPWSNKNLTLKWEHLTSKLDPGAKDTWTLSIAGPDKEKAAAEMTAVLYDASLDAMSKHAWRTSLDCFRADQSHFNPDFYNEIMDFEEAVEEWTQDREAENASLRNWPFLSVSSAASRYLADLEGLGGLSGGAVTRGLRFGSDAVSRNAIDGLLNEAPNSVDYSTAAPAAPLMAVGGALSERSFGRPVAAASVAKSKPDAPAETRSIAARKNMQETAFFLPQLLAGDDGTVKMEFTMPEAVTTWRFMGFAHDKKLRSGFIEGETVTSRDLMVQPNPPRFLREGDAVEFTVKITNQSDAPQHGIARLGFADAATLTPADAALGLTAPDQPFDVPAKESRTVAWRITVPDGQGFLTWKATAGTDKVSDGEEGWLPVLSRRVLLTESLPLTMSGAGEKEYTFQKLTDSAASQTLRHQSLTVQMVSQPSWYAVMALPYLMEFPHECSEQTFNRFYANALAQHIAKSDPKIRRTFDLWRDAQPQALESPLLKNQELKSLLIEETPWLRDAAKETEQRRNVGLLFDANRLDSETARVLDQLDGLQREDGAWPWFPGGPGNEFITLYVVAGFGKLNHLGVQVKTEMATEALDWLDTWLEREHKTALKSDRSRKDGKEGDHLSNEIALYLYARSFYLEQRPVPEEQKAAVDYFLAQARSKWPGKGRMTQANAALGLLRFGDKPAASKILASLKERSVIKEELGRYWPEAADLWRWDAAPIETQALMIEAFRDIAKDTETADECALWLLKQKQTQAWPTSKATADACYALILGGTGKLSSDAAVSISLAGNEVKPEKVEAGTGFFEKKIAAADIKPDLSKVKLVKTDKGAAWGSVHWQYLEDMSKVTPHEGTPLKITKTLFTKTNTPAGPQLQPVQGKVKVGDELVVRLELRTDRDMEFVHLKDQRPSSVEPVNVLSEYKWQDGLGYYESTRDTASHFFFESLPKGTYVFEYSSRVQLRGACQTGIAELQCMYAPEFNSHSAGMVLEAE